MNSFKHRTCMGDTSGTSSNLFWYLSRNFKNVTVVTNHLIININKCNPMRIGCHFEVPREIMTKRAVINVRSMDNACLAWSVVAALYPSERNADRESSYPHYTMMLTLQNLEFRIMLKDVTKFEGLNDVSINVYGIEGQKTLCSPDTSC